MLFKQLWSISLVPSDSTSSMMWVQRKEQNWGEGRLHYKAVFGSFLLSSVAREVMQLNAFIFGVIKQLNGYTTGSKKIFFSLIVFIHLSLVIMLPCSGSSYPRQEYTHIHPYTYYIHCKVPCLCSTFSHLHSHMFSRRWKQTG